MFVRACRVFSLYNFQLLWVCVCVCVCVFHYPFPVSQSTPPPSPKGESRGGAACNRFFENFPLGILSKNYVSVSQASFAFLPPTLSDTTWISVLLSGFDWRNLFEKLCRNHGARCNHTPAAQCVCSKAFLTPNNHPCPNFRTFYKKFTGNFEVFQNMS